MPLNTNTNMKYCKYVCEVLYIYPMFYFDIYNSQKVLKSDFLTGVNAFFTTRSADINLITKGQRLVITPEQTHSDHVEIVDERTEYPDTDGLIITEPNTLIYLRFADCTPLIFMMK